MDQSRLRPADKVIKEFYWIKDFLNHENYEMGFHSGKRMEIEILYIWVTDFASKESIR